MRYLGVLLLLISLEAPAQKTLTSGVFQVNVRPVLNGIIRDFYQMLELFPDFPKELHPVMEDLDALASDRDTLKASCPRILNGKCKETVDALRAKLRDIREKSLRLLKEQKMSHSLHVNTLAGLRLLSEFDTALEDLKGYLDNSSLLQSAGLPARRETYTVLKKIDELGTILSLAVVEFIPYPYKEDFRHFFFNFVHPVELQLSKGNNYQFLNKNLNSLNFTLNLLNMNLTKKNKKTPEGMAPFLSVIHSKWNSLLRYYL
ncbi:MAG TPA: hypothetical protein VNJ01_03240 [Bacteriovoracaceae bacterium]|nr:hypothetical protein [Bacteriovoracaceae bacterium]